MRRLMVLLLCFTPLQGCIKTKTVAAEGLPEAPQVKPDGDIPPIANPGDGILQNDEVEASALDDGLQLLNADALNTIYISAANYENQGQDVGDAVKALEHGLNLLSNRVQLGRVRALPDNPSILAVDLRDFFGNRSAQIYRLIEDNAVIKIVSQSVRFRNLQFLTQKRIPLMHAQIFLESAFQAKVYYDIKQIPLNELEFWRQQGIDEQQQFDDRDKGIFLAGFEVSQIAPGHNRFVRRMVGLQGACYKTFDVDGLQIVAQSNFTNFPFPKEARSQQTFVFNAGEILCVQPNGLYVMALYNAQGIRLDAAPTTVVVNTRAAKIGLDPSITIRDCEGCHTSFVLTPVIDELGPQIASRPFGAQDKALGELFFKPQAQLDAVISADNEEHSVAMASLGIQTGGLPVMNSSLDELRNGADAKELASFVYLSETEFLSRLAGSQKAQNIFGNLLSGGKVGFFTIQQNFAVLQDDLNLFRDIQ